MPCRWRTLPSVTTAATSLEQILRAGETVVWSGRPQTRLLTPLKVNWTNLVQLPIAAVVIWFWARQGGGVMLYVFIAFLIAMLVSSPFIARRRLGRTTYYLTDRRAVCADGKTVTTMGLGASPFLTYSAGGRLVSATFGTQAPPDRWAWLKTPVATELVFRDVADVEGLVGALDHVARGTEPKQLRAEWATYEADGSAARTTGQHAG